MPTYQTEANVGVYVRRETTAGVVATATGAHTVRIIPSPGLELKRAQVPSQELRDDAEQAMPRLGAKMVEGSYNLELTVGGAVDLLLESLQRSAWATATAVALTSCAFTTNAITQPSGDFVGTSGLRVGDIFSVTGTATAGNHDKRTPIIAIGSLTITVPLGTFVTATSTGTLTRLKKLSTASTPTRYSHTFEQVNEDIDGSERFIGCRIVGGRLSFRPGQMATVSFSVLGTDRDVLTGVSSPYFTSPTATTGNALVADDSAIYADGVAVTAFTGIELDFTINARGEAVIGSSVAADVVDNTMQRGGTITALRSDFTAMTAYDAETEFSLMLILVEPTTAPKPCLALYLPRVKFGAVVAPAGGGEGSKVETRTLMIGPKVAATGHDATAATWFSSAT